MSDKKQMNALQWLWHRKVKHRRKRNAPKASPSLPAQPKMPPKMPEGVYIATIALVLDGEVQEVIRAQDRLAALLLSEPEIIEITDLEPKPTLGWKYENNQFIAPEPEQAGETNVEKS